jgi:RNA polymerase sigma-70 factor (ECF subfamily)
MRLSASGDREAFESLYNRYTDALFRYFTRMLWNDTELARDQTQEVFMKIIQKPNLYDPSRSFKTWIYSMAHNMCKNNYRHKEVQQRAESELLRSPFYESENASQSEKGEFRKALAQAVNSLESNKKDTFILRFKHELSIKEIAEIMQTSDGTVKSRIFYTLRELAVMLKEYNPNLST